MVFFAFALRFFSTFSLSVLFFLHIFLLFPQLVTLHFAFKFKPFLHLPIFLSTIIVCMRVRFFEVSSSRSQLQYQQRPLHVFSAPKVSPTIPISQQRRPSASGASTAPVPIGRENANSKKKYFVVQRGWDKKTN